MVESAILIVGIQQLKGILSILHTNLRPWLNVLRLGVKDVSAERRAWGGGGGIAVCKTVKTVTDT